MPFIKIDQAGYDQFTGSLGGHEFINGFSEENIGQREAERLGSILPIVNVESGEQCNAASALEGRLRPKNIEKSVESVELKGAVVDAVIYDEIQENDSVKHLYTEAELSVIADEGGIQALREIGQEFDVKDTSIRALIMKILNAQGK